MKQTIYSDCSPVSAELCVSRANKRVRQLNFRQADRPAGVKRASLFLAALATTNG
jgi:hypothetical protein